SAVREHDLSRNVEAQPHAAEMMPQRFDALEALEDPSLIVARDTNALILHLQLDLRFAPLDADPDRLIRSVLDGVGDQVEQELLGPEAIPLSSHTGTFDQRDGATGLHQLRAQLSEHLLHQIVHIADLALNTEPTCVDERNVEKLIHQVT